MSPDSQPGRRADASRNAALLLAAAREVLAEAGNDVAFDVIARRAGVGNATLYRHFPTRADLLVAVYAEEVAALCRLGDDLRAAADPLDALFIWLGAFIDHVGTKRPLALAATEGAEGRRTALFEQWHRSINDTAAELVRRARPMLRPGLTATDVMTLASGVALATGTGTGHAHRLLSLIRTGLAARPDPGFGD